MSEQQLQDELARFLSGGDKQNDWFTGLIVEHTESVVMLDNYDKETYTDENGNEITEYKDGENVFDRIIKSKDENGNVLETKNFYDR